MSDTSHLESALIQLRKFCGYQERCHKEVRTKLLKIRVYGDDLEKVMTQLIQEDYLNEERFARSYARGKFRINHWGRYRIRIELKRKSVSEYCINRGLEEIDDEEYVAWVDDFITKKLPDNPDWPTRKKVSDALMRKGYESELVKERIGRYCN